LGKVAWARGEASQAQAYYQQALGLNAWDTQDMNGYTARPPHIQHALEGLAAMMAQTQVEAAARLLGATEAWHQRFFYLRLPRERQEREACRATVHASLGEQAFATAWAEGQAMTIDAAVALALEVAEEIEI
jgi:hypothetical protein